MSTVSPTPRQQSNSPPPSPPPSTSAASGPRATALQDAFHKALEATLSKVSYESFATCFPTPAAHRPEVLRAFWADFTRRLDQVCKAQFESILQERDVVPSLNTLDQLIMDARERKESASTAALSSGGPVEIPVPTHTLPPSALLSAHLSPFLHEQQAALAAALTALQDSNISLADTIVEQKADIKTLIANLESTIKDLEKVAGMVQGQEMEGVTEEVRDMEAQLAKDGKESGG